MRHSIALAALALTIAACHRPEPVGEGDRGSLVAAADTTVGQGTLAEMREYQAKWAATRAGRDYEFTVQRGCFCVEEARRPVVVLVVGDRVASVRDAETGKAPSVDFQWQTIEQVFAAAIQDAEAGRVRPVTWAASGYPKEISIGAVEADAGWTLSISKVVVK